MSEPVRVLITTGNNSQESSQSNPSSQNNEASGVLSSNGGILKTLGAKRLISASLAVGKQLANNYISQYGDRTGDYTQQQQLENMYAVGNQMASSTLTVGAGFFMGGTPGLFFGLGLTATNMIIDAINTEKRAKMNNDRTNQQTAFNSSLIGSILKDGNR